jgi:hypothetical protein
MNTSASLRAHTSTHSHSSPSQQQCCPVRRHRKLRYRGRARSSRHDPGFPQLPVTVPTLQNTDHVNLRSQAPDAVTLSCRMSNIRSHASFSNAIQKRQVLAEKTCCLLHSRKEEKRLSMEKKSHRTNQSKLKQPPVR